jgi:tetratricopeptide (TPR) repeat protein
MVDHMGADPSSRPALVGRDAVIELLTKAIEDTLAGTGQLVLVAGEPGIGKTTVAAEAARLAGHRGFGVVWASCWPGEGVPGYWPWVQVVRHLLARSESERSKTIGAEAPVLAKLLVERAEPHGGRPADELTAETVRFRLFDEVATTLAGEARTKPLLVVLDDLQWADAASLRLLEYVGRHVRSAPIAVVGTYRDLDVAEDAERAPLLAAVGRSGTVVPLATLTEDEVSSVMSRILGEEPEPATAEDVHRRTGGNPFFVHQVTRLLAAEGAGPAPSIPLGVRDAVEQRLARLGNPSVELLRIAAAAGPEFAAELLSEVSGLSPSAVGDLLDEAVRARILVAPVEPHHPHRFAHDLYREAILDGMSASFRAGLHLRLGLVLEERREAGRAVALAELADHFVLASGADPEAEELAARYSSLAAREAARRLAHEEAALRWERALAAFDVSSPGHAAGRTEILLELGEARRRAGALTGSRTAYQDALDLTRRGRDARGVARAALGLHAIGSRTGGPHEELVGLLGEASAGLDEDVSPLHARAMAALARERSWFGVSGDEDPAALAARAVAMARTTDDRATLAVCLLARHNVMWGPGNAAERLALAREILDIAGEIDHPELAVEARILVVADLLELGDPAVPREIEELARAAAPLRQPRLRYAVAVRRAMWAIVSSARAEAERLVLEAAALGDEIGEPDAPDVRFAQLWPVRWDQGRMGELVQEMEPWFAQSNLRPAEAWMRAETRLLAGDRDGAVAAAAPLIETDLDAIPRDRQWLMAMSMAAAMIAALDGGPQAERTMAMLAPFAGSMATTGAGVSSQPSVDHSLGLLAAALGRTGEARAHFGRAVAIHQRLGAEPWVLKSRFELARLEMAVEGDSSAAAAAVEAIIELAQEADRLGMTVLAGEARASLPTGLEVPTQRGVFRREGHTWIVGLGEEAVQVKDAKGLHDIAALLSVAGEPVHVIELAGAGGNEAKASLRMGADAALDDRARREYRARLAELEDEVEQAERWSDPERASRARAERDTVLHELAVAAGLGGRVRRLGDQAERARKAVTARIRDSLGRIEKVHPVLAAHLNRSITTGTLCRYSPPEPTRWDL